MQRTELRRWDGLLRARQGHFRILVLFVPVSFRNTPFLAILKARCKSLLSQIDLKPIFLSYCRPQNWGKVRGPPLDPRGLCVWGMLGTYSVYIFLYKAGGERASPSSRPSGCRCKRKF